MMKLSLTATCVLVILIFTFFSCMLFAGSPVWVGGYQVALEGYTQGGPFFPGEYLHAGLFFEPFDWHVLNPVASATVLVPLFPQTVEPTWIELQLGLQLFSIKNHPIDTMLIRDSHIIPSVHAGFLFNSRDFSQSLITMTFQPFSFFFGEKTIRLLGVRLHYDRGSSSYGWGLRLFEISQFLW